MKKALIKVGWLLCGAVFSAIATLLISGQPLAGLTKLAGLSRTFLSSSVPAWVFAVVLFLALFGLYEFFAHFLKTRKSKGWVHFVPDSHNSGWSQAGAVMEVRVGGTFTYEGIGMLTVLRAFLPETRLVTDMIATVIPSNHQPIVVGNLDLTAHVPVRAIIHMRLTPVMGIPGKSFRGRVVFRNQFNKDFRFDVDLPYLGAPASKAG
jgi:hypothetical protein